MKPAGLDTAVAGFQDCVVAWVLLALFSGSTLVADNSSKSDDETLTLRDPSKVWLVNMIPRALSNETSQNSGTMIAVHEGQKHVVGTAYKLRYFPTDGTPLLVSSDSGWNWSLMPALPPQHSSSTLVFIADTLYWGGSRLRNDPGDIGLSVFRIPYPSDESERLRPHEYVISTGQLADDPQILARLVDGRERVWIGNNDFGAENGRTASVLISSDLLSGYRNVSIESRSTASQDGPQVRLTIHDDGTVYAVYYGWRSTSRSFNNELRVTSDIVVVRDDNWGKANSPFQDLKDPDDNLSGRRVAQGISYAFNNRGEPRNGQERLGGALSIAVDPRPGMSSAVYLTWLDEPSEGDFTTHVRRSTDRGLTWSSADLLTISKATQAVLAIDSNGVVGLLYRQLSGIGDSLRWSVHFRRSTDGTDWSDLILSDTPAKTPVSTFSPYLGETSLFGVDDTFYGGFSASNNPNPECFPQGVRFLRNHKIGELLSYQGRQSVPVSIDPFFFRIRSDSSARLALASLKIVDNTDIKSVLPLAEKSEVKHSPSTPSDDEKTPLLPEPPLLPRWVWYAGTVLGGIYGSCVLLLFTCPIALLSIHKSISLPKLVDTFGLDTKAVLGLKTILAITFLPLFAKNRRTRSAFIERYRSGKSDFNKLDPLIRHDFISHADCLDAWVERRLKHAGDSLERIPAVEKRKIYIPMPLRVTEDGASSIITTPTATDFTPALGAHQTVMLLVGGGGAGKSTLACQLARWALSRSDPLSLHPMIPIFIDRETTDLKTSIWRELIRMVGEEEIDSPMLESLLRHKRLIVIVDSLSEWRRAGQKHIESIHGELPQLNALVVTSRRRHDFGPAKVTSIEPQRVERERLLFFLVEYLRTIDAQSLFPDERLEDLRDRIVALATVGGDHLVLTPLLICLVVNNAVALVSTGKNLDELSESVPALILESLRLVNPQDAGIDDAVSHELMLKGAIELARLLIGEDYIPTRVPENHADDALEKEKVENPAAVIIRLTKNGVLMRQDIAGKQFLSFNLDSVAEYLAALGWIHALSDMADDKPVLERHPSRSAAVIATREAALVTLQEKTDEINRSSDVNKAALLDEQIAHLELRLWVSSHEKKGRVEVVALRDNVQWKTWIEILRSAPGFPVEQEGFLLALVNCVKTYKQELKTPELVWEFACEFY